MKKTLAISIALLLITLLVGCSNNNSSTVSEYVAPKESYQQQDLEHVTEATTEALGTNITHKEQYDLSDGQVFKDGVAWVTIRNKDDNKEHLALVNSKGEVVFFADSVSFDGDNNNITTTPFVNDLAAVYRKKTESKPGFIIINSNGETLYSCSDENMYLCGLADDGTFMILKHDSGFDHDKWMLCTMDGSLNLVETGLDIDKELLRGYEFKKLADNLYLYLYNSGGCGGIINIKNKAYIRPSQYKGYYYCSRDYLRWNDLYDGDYFIPNDILINLKTSGEIDKTALNDSSVIHFQRSEELKDLLGYEKKFKLWNGGSYFQKYQKKDKDNTTIREYADKSGKSIFTFPEFPDGVQYVDIDDFSGKYVAVDLIGVDDKPYVTLIDDTGKTAYEPLQIKSKYYKGCSCNGYIFLYYYGDGKYYEIIAPDGTTKRFGDDLSGLGEATLVYKEDFKLYIGGGYIFYNDNGTNKYISYDGKTILDTITASYNSNNALVFTNADGNKIIGGINKIDERSTDNTTSTDSSIVATANPKEYVNKNDFSIIGKWKNVGDYTYGQAQKGSIIAFDGKNCNFFSPKDTYAFYKNGDNYKLDCTSPLADTVSFTVKIVDENNIDVFNGSNIVELKRVN